MLEENRRQQSGAVGDEKTGQLLRILEEMDDVVGLLSEHQLAVILQQAILACGFTDEDEGWQALLTSIDDEFKARQGLSRAT